MSNIITYEQKIGGQRKSPTMLTLIEPVIRFNQFLGVCPHEISGEILIFRWGSVKFFKTIFTLIVLFAYFIFTGFMFFKSMIGGKSIVTLGIISSRVTGTFIPIAVLCLTLQKRDQFTQFFLKVKEFSAELKGISNCYFVVQRARRFYAFYMFLALISCVLTVTDTLWNPKYPVYFVQFFPEPTTLVRVLDAIFQFYITLVTHSACAVVEVLCSTLSGSNVNKICKIQYEMESRILDQNYTTLCSNGAIAHAQSTSEENLSTDNQDENLVVVSSSSDPPCYNAAVILPFPENFEVPKPPKSNQDGKKGSIKPIIKAIKKFHCIAQIQSLINCIFGSILALNIAWLVIEVCLLFFMEIRQLNPNSNSEENENAGIQGLFMIMGHNFVFTIRLLIVLINLGNLHEATKWFDSTVSGALIKVKKSQTPSSDMDLVMIHLMRNQTSPVAFSAGGFFVVSRGTLLYVFSIVTTYVVFLLQAEAAGGFQLPAVNSTLETLGI